MKKTKKIILKVLLYIVTISLLIFCIFYDLALANMNFPVLTTIYFVIFMGVRLSRYLLR